MTSRWALWHPLAVASTLLSNFAHIITFDDEGRELKDVDILVSDGRISSVGTNLDAGHNATVVDCSGLIAFPGLINAHQHLYQIGIRALPEHERTTMGPWLRGVHELVVSRCGAMTY